MLEPHRFFGTYVGYDDPSPEECWHHTMPLPNGRRMRSNRIANPDAQLLLWNALGMTSLAGKCVLDVGAADGFFSIASKASGAGKVVALDFNYADWPRNITRVAEEWDAEIDIVTGDFHTLALPGKADVILFLGVLYHLENVFAAMKKLRSLLEPTGSVFIETQMSGIASGCPAFEYASDTFQTIARQGRESLGSVGVSNFLFPNHEAMLNLADTYGFKAERLLDNEFIRTYPLRGLYRFDPC